MGRPPLPVGTYGNIETTQLDGRGWRARTWFRDLDGKRRRVERRAPTKTAAVNALKTALADRQAPAEDAAVTGETRVDVLARRWLDSLTTEGRLRQQSIDTYADIVKNLIVPHLGGLQLREVTAARVQALFTRTLSGAGARRAAPPLRMLLDIAVAADVLDTNPARQIRLPRTAGQTDTEYLTAEQILDLRAKLDLWAEGKLDGQKAGYHRTRRASRVALPDIVDLAVATGCRTSEILALRFQDVDFTTDPVTLTVAGTLVRVAGRGTIRQPFTKTDAGHRTLALPGFAETVLRDRLRDRQLGVTDGVVFPGDDGGLMTAGAVQREWRLCRDLAGFPGLELRALRRSVATLIAEAAGVDAAAAQLGHHGTAVTEKHYIARKAAVAPNLTDLLQALA